MMSFSKMQIYIFISCDIWHFFTTFFYFLQWIRLFEKVGNLSILTIFNIFAPLLCLENVCLYMYLNYVVYKDVRVFAEKYPVMLVLCPSIKSSCSALFNKNLTDS